MRYSVIGLGKLGSSMAAAIASRNLNVVGVDISKNSVDCINNGTAPVHETNLAETIANNKAMLRATLDVTEAVADSDVSFVVVQTPSTTEGSFSLQYAKAAFCEIGKALKEKSGYHLVVMTSTVLPGSVRYALLPILEEKSGKKCGQDFGLCYSPEFIALGSIIHDFLNPDFTLVGEFDDRSGGLLEMCYAEIMQNSPICKRMSLENAELAKIALNTFVTTKITYANMLSEICESIPGGSIDAVTDAIGCDSRIGHKYLKGAIGYGGPCFPRDNIALSYIAEKLGARMVIAEVTDSFNRTIPAIIFERIESLITQTTVVAILGLAYKPLSHVTEESQGVYLAELLMSLGVSIVCYDPLSDKMHDKLPFSLNLKECLSRADIVLITTPDPAFADLTPEDFKPDATVIDFWRILKNPPLKYVPSGYCTDNQTAAARLESIWRD